MSIWSRDYALHNWSSGVTESRAAIYRETPQRTVAVEGRLIPLPRQVTHQLMYFRVVRGKECTFKRMHSLFHLALRNAAKAKNLFVHERIQT